MPAEELTAVPKMRVKLLYSKKGAEGTINVADFDPKRHAPLGKEEVAKLDPTVAATLSDEPDPAPATGEPAKRATSR